MNDTNRALNRLFIFVVGLVLLVVGAATALLAWPWWASRWEETGTTVRSAVADALTAAPVPGADFSWWLVAAVALLLVIVILMIAIIASVGGGGSREIYRKPVTEKAPSSDAASPAASAASAASSDRLLIDTSFAAEALKHSLDKRPDLVGSTVGAFTVKGRPVLHVGVTARQGASPRLIMDETHRLIDALALVVGDAPASCVTIHSGLRATLGHDQRVR